MIVLDCLNQTAVKVSLSAVKKIVGDFERAAKITKPSHLSLVFTDKRSIKKWNRIYRGKNQATDVLSFAQRDAEAIPGEADDLGEILICLPIAQEQAKQYGWSLETEIKRLLIHGLAHLIGYEHEGVSKIEADKMRKFEETVMAK